MNKELMEGINKAIAGMNKMSHVNEAPFATEPNFRWTVYKGELAGKPYATAGINAKFLEYLNHDELDTWMHSNTKYAIIIVVRSDGKWVMYDQPNGKTFKKASSGDNFNQVWKGRYNKKADVS